MRRTWFIALAVMWCVATAHANSIPVFNLTQGTVTATSSYIGGPVSISWSFSGPGGAFAGGTGDQGGICFSGGMPGDICAPDLSITAFGPNIGSAFGPGLGNSGSQVFFYGNGISISGPTFTLPPADVGAFTITLPVIFSGSLTACPLDPGLRHLRPDRGI
jgi:hypothetical protein